MTNTLALFYPARMESEDKIRFGEKTCKIIYYRPPRGFFSRQKVKRRLSRFAADTCTTNQKMAELLHLPYIEDGGALLSALSKKLLFSISRKTPCVFVVGHTYDLGLLCRLVDSMQNPEFVAPRAECDAIFDALLEKTGAAVPILPSPSFSKKLCVLLPEASMAFPAPERCLDFRRGLPESAKLIPPPQFRTIWHMIEQESQLPFLQFFGIKAADIEIFC